MLSTKTRHYYTDKVILYELYNFYKYLTKTVSTSLVFSKGVRLEEKFIHFLFVNKNQTKFIGGSILFLGRTLIVY